MQKIQQGNIYNWKRQKIVKLTEDVLVFALKILFLYRKGVTLFKSSPLQQ
ncbi:hypothetical protein MTBBW1_340033 [Desulfamplus magnetovallimortis]|uniref:Uncharacterized protein n=1 Tax=Desulfamplus magnetovallimortis TaxID=1246637 RepID=A0A1W1HG45_9BACT|nr:hypothetical protein MTBBW1_340033 [Desulfamplus magnetovallimortis]